MNRKPEPKPLIWMASSLEDLRAFPERVQHSLGYALYIAQLGRKHPSAKPLKGFGGAGVLEIVADHEGATFRAVYTIGLKARIYVLHAFQKKATRGIATPKRTLELLRDRLRQAHAIHREWLEKQASQ